MCSCEVRCGQVGDAHSLFDKIEYLSSGQIFWWKSASSTNFPGGQCWPLSIETKLESSHDKKEIGSRAWGSQELSM
jgi:hypothetical protein